MKLDIDMTSISNMEFDLQEDREYLEIVKDILSNENFKSMGTYYHHGTVTCLEHSVHVSYCCYTYAKKHNMNYIASARAGLLHDFFLYDWHDLYKETGEWYHGFTHPKKALNNAKKEFELNYVEENIILRHMWPLTIVPPKYKESFLIVMVDKYCGLLETIHQTKLIFRKKREA